MVRGLVATGRVDSSKPFEPLVRERLSERFVRASAYPVTVVAAPAGFGKSVAIHHFLSADTTHVWFSLRNEDRSLDGFVRGLLRAFKAPSSKLKGFASAAKIAREQPSPVLELARVVSDVLLGRTETVVVDNLHLASPEALTFLVELIDRAGEGSRWILATRNPLDLPLATWLAYRRMDMPVDEVDLRLWQEEAQQIAGASVPSATESDVTGLWELTGGWPTAFTFGLHLLSRAQKFKRVAGTTREMVYGYLVEQVFTTLGDGDRAFLLATAFLPELRPEQLVVGGYPDAQFALNRLQRLTGFIKAEPNGAFTYLDLFREFLQYQLQQLGKTEYERAAKFAAELLEGNGRPAEALALYRQVLDADSVARFLAAHGSELVVRGALEQVGLALAVLPADLRESRPELVALSADLKARSGQLSEAVALYKSSLEALDGVDARASVACRLLSALSDCSDLIGANKILAQVGGAPIQNRSLRARFLALRALIRCRSGVSADEVLGLTREATELVSQNEDPTARAAVLQTSAVINYLLDSFEDSQEAASEALSISESENLSSLAARSALVLAEVAGALCNQTNASWASSQALRYAGAAQDRVAWLAALAESYALAVERYDLEKLGELDKSLELAASLKYRPVKLTSALAVRLAWNGDFAAAHDLLRSAADPVGNPRRAILRCAERALYAAGANVRDEAEEAIRDWQDQIGAFERPEAGHTRALVLSRIWAAMASLLLGRAAGANHALRDVEREARRIAPPLRALCSLARATYIHVETGSAQRDISRALESVREAGMGGYGRLLEQLPLPAAASSPRFGSLTRTEVRVLRLLAVGGSSKSIGAELERSPQTIDSHIKAVIRKLGCSGRQEAVGLARQHGII